MANAHEVCFICMWTMTWCNRVRSKSALLIRFLLDFATITCVNARILLCRFAIGAYRCGNILLEVLYCTSVVRYSSHNIHTNGPQSVCVPASEAAPCMYKYTRATQRCQYPQQSRCGNPNSATTKCSTSRRNMKKRTDGRHNASL